MVESPTWAPTPARIAALLWEHARDTQDTDDESGVLTDATLGQFTENTDPPLALVEELISQACDEMAGLLEGHAPCSTGLAAGVTAATSYLAAALVDRAKDVQSANGEQSGYQTLYAQWKDRGPAIAERIKASCPFVPDPGDPAGIDGDLRAVGIFSAPDPNPPRWDAPTYWDHPEAPGGGWYGGRLGDLW
jgi:hypothetical protein